MNSTRAPTRTTCQGRRAGRSPRQARLQPRGALFHAGVVLLGGHHLDRVAAGRRTASGWPTAWCPCRNGPGSRAWLASIALRDVVGHGPRRRWACRPPRICRRRTCRGQPVHAGVAAKAGRHGVRLVDDQKRAMRVASACAGRRGKPGAGRTMQELVITGSVRIAATSPLASAASTPARSLNSHATAVRSGRRPAPAGRGG
jgi:hypothetical protein